MPIFHAWPQCEPQHTHIHTVVLRHQLQQMTELLLCEYVCEVYTLSSSLPHLQQSIRHFPRGGGVALAQLHRPPPPPPPPSLHTFTPAAVGPSPPARRQGRPCPAAPQLGSAPPPPTLPHFHTCSSRSVTSRAAAGSPLPSCTATRVCPEMARESTTSEDRIHTWLRTCGRGGGGETTVRPGRGD